ncbi:hypothetical protein [Methanobrevibacter sp.]|uniref:hypothetical protein n=1 Tax=Methanobrevibacter sp. TaxID=66852 RepID=UPI00386AD880
MIICIFSITSVSASDLNATDVGLIEDMSENNFLNDETKELDSVDGSNEVLALNNESNTLSTTYYPTSVSQLKSDISSAKAGDTIVLSGTYKIHDYTISKELTFIGTNGATLDGDDNKVFSTKDSTVTFKNITFKNGYGRYGGTLDAHSGQVIFDNCKFLKSYAAYRGGTIFVDGTASCKITNSYFTNSKVGDGSGGAICIETYGEIINCTFEGCSATDNGGAIRITGSSAIIENCTFKGCRASYGGGVQSQGQTNLRIIGSTFVNGNAKYGGAIHINGNTKQMTIDGCNFINNVASEDGGAISRYESSSVDIINSNFEGNSAQWGGAIYLKYTDGKLSNCTFKNNHASVDSGAVSGGVLTDCTFIGNTAVDFGGAAAWGSYINCNFINNSANNYGGAINNGNSIENCIFINNSANNYAGAIHSNDRDYLKIKDCYFEKCQARTCGGAIDIYKVKDVNIIDCDFYECYTDINDGGAISSDSCTNVNIFGCDFDSCKSNGFGGSVRVVNTGNLLTISDCNFSDSYSNMEGGSVYSKNVPNVIIDNCDFLNSSSNLTGGSVFILTTTNANLNDLYFKDSDSGNFAGSLYINDVTNFNLSNSEFINSHAKMTGGAIHVNPATNLNISDCLFDSCSAELYGNSLDIGFTKNTIIRNSNFTNSNYNGQEAITFPGSEKYEIVDSIFDVAPKDVIYHYDTILSAGDLSIVNGEQCTIRATLSYVAGPLSNKIVTFNLNGNSYSRTTSSDGVVSFNANDYIGGLGNHEVIVSYEGDSINNAVSKTINVQVNDYRATLIVTQYGEGYYGDKSLSFKVVDSDNNLKYNVPVHVDIYLNGKLCDAKDISTGSSGMVAYSMSTFEPGNYSVKAYVTTQNVDVNSVEEDNIVISKISGVIELSTSNNNKTLNIRLVNPANGYVYGGIPVKLQFNPNGYETTVATDSSGFVSVPLMFDLGTYGVVASVDSSGFKEFPIAELQNIVISTAGKDDSVVKFNNAIVFDYLKSGSTTLTLEGCTVTREKVSVDGHPEASIVGSGNKITVSGLAAGSYTLRVVSTPDQYHNSVTRTVGITVNKVDSVITIAKPVSFSYGESGSTNVNVNGGSVDYNGVSVDDHPEAFIGVVNNAITVSNLPVGSYTLRITSTPDSNHNAVTKTTTITVNKVDSKISFDKAISFVYGKSGSAALTLTGCSIVREGISVDGHPEAIIDVNNNVVTVSNLSVGGYTLRITSVPDSNHNAVTNTIVVTVSKADSDVKFSKAINYDYGGSGSTTLTLTGCSVTLGNIKVDNHPEAVIRINNNVVSVSNLAMGSYTLRITSTPDSNHNSVTRAVGITVNKANSKVEFTNPIVFDYLDVGLTTLILDGCTVPLSNIKVIDHDEALISINNNNVISVSGLNAGNYTLSVESIPDDNHRASTSTIGITVNKINSKISFTEKNISFKYSKSGATSVVLENCKIASMSIVGKNVKPTLKDNVISISGLDVGNYVLKVTTAPRNENYNSVDAFIDVVVTKNTAKITAKSKNFAYKSGVKWAITLKDASNSPISGMKVAIKVFTGKKAKTYSATTNSKGVANFAASKLSVGKHKVVLSVSHKGYTNKAVTSSVKIIKPTELKFKLQQKTSNSKGEGGVSYMVLDKKTGKGINGVKFKCLIYTDKKYTTHYLTTKKIKGVNTVYNGAVGFITNQYSVGKHTVKLIPVDIKYKGSLTTSFTIKKTKAASGGKYFRVT